MADVLPILDAPAFFSTRASNSFSADERPTSYRQKVLELFPNGEAPLTAITSMCDTESVDDPEFNWWTQTLPQQGGAITDQFTTPDTGGTPVTTATFAQDVTVWLQVKAVVARHFVEGKQALIRKENYPGNDLMSKVVKVIIAGDNSLLGCKLDQSAGASVIGTATHVKLVGNRNPEGGTRVAGVSYDPTKYYAFTQIFRNSLDSTRTAQRTKLRTEDVMQKLRREALMLHAIDIDQALLHGYGRETLGDNNKPERTIHGILNYIADFSDAQIALGGETFRPAFNTSSETAFDGKSWLEAGEEFIERYLEHLFMYGSTERIALCGSGVLRGINKLVKQGVNIQAPVTGVTSYGLRVTRWETPYGMVWFKTAPKMTQDPIDRYKCVFMSPENLIIRTLDDTRLNTIADSKTTDGMGESGYDGTIEEYLAELGLELHHPETFMSWDGVGKDHINFVA